MTNELKTVKQGEQVRRTIRTNEDITSIHHVTYNKPTDARYEMDWHIDFTDVSETEKQELAAKNILIAARPAFKNDKHPGDEWNDYTISVREMLDSGRGKPKSPLKGAFDYWNQMTEAEREQFLQALKERDENNS